MVPDELKEINQAISVLGAATGLIVKIETRYIKYNNNGSTYEYHVGCEAVSSYVKEAIEIQKEKILREVKQKLIQRRLELITAAVQTLSPEEAKKVFIATLLKESEEEALQVKENESNDTDTDEEDEEDVNLPF